MPLAPASNLLSMPLCQLNVETGTNEDWIDSIKFLVDDGSGDTDTMPQLDLRGITFEMEVRKAPPDHGVVINASTDDGSLSVGDPPDFGYLIINVDVEEMKLNQPGNYVADIVGSDAVSQRVVATISLTLVQGITR